MLVKESVSNFSSGNTEYYNWTDLIDHLQTINNSQSVTVNVFLCIF